MGHIELRCVPFVFEKVPDDRQGTNILQAGDGTRCFIPGLPDIILNNMVLLFFG